MFKNIAKIQTLFHRDDRIEISFGNDFDIKMLRKLEDIKVDQDKQVTGYASKLKDKINVITLNRVPPQVEDNTLIKYL